MAIVFIDQKICFVRLELTPTEIPGLLQRHRENYPGAAPLEGIGNDLRAAGFEPAAAMEFVERVVRWGRGQRFVGRLLEQNTPAAIGSALRHANELLVNGRTAEAVVSLQQLRFLGQSFASKVARFLNPDEAVILDEVIRTALGYRENQEGYQEFLDDCRAMLNLLTSHDLSLRVCDVEAAIFAKIQGY
jgi:hypothetical protein